MLYEEGVLVAAPPYLLWLNDTDHDEKADKIDTLMGGFATGNLQHNYNSLTLGLDGWIYAANGGNDGSPYWWGDSANALPLRNQDFRFNLKTQEMERFGESSGGFGLAMDAFGRFFETHNTQHISHLVFANRYLKDRPILTDHTLENISDHEENGLARIYPIGEQEERVNHPEQSGYFSGSCGITFYEGGALGPEFENTVWVADVVLNLLHADRLEPNGASFQAKRVLEKQDVLASVDRAFRPVNMTVGPDGAMYVLDMHRKVIEHPEWIPDEMEKAMDLNAGKTEGRIYKISRNRLSEPYDFSTPESLVKSL
jgi:putative membrane-bound dehydrogenase-like protein